MISSKEIKTLAISLKEIDINSWFKKNRFVNILVISSKDIKTLIIGSRKINLSVYCLLVQKLQNLVQKK